jgi:starch phosphorylase
MASRVATQSPATAGKAGYSQSVRSGLEADTIATALIDNLHCLQGKLPQHATRNDWYRALAYTVRDRMMHRYIGTVESISQTNTNAKVVAYLSAEFLTGPHLGNGLINLGIWDAVEQALSKLGQNLSTLLEQEEEPGLGNGGLGRLAACYMDSLATLNVPAIGYGLRYEFASSIRQFATAGRSS